jgi:signal transduction histidine kinase
LDAVSGSRCDILLLDLTLPDSRGFRTFAEMRAKASQLPIIVLTGLDNEDLAIKSLHEGAQDYVVKGRVDPDLLERVVRYAIERHKIQRELEEARDAAQAANRAKSAFLANMSHELKTPLTAILGSCELLLHDVAGPLNDGQKKALDAMQKSGQHLLSLISDLLDLAKVEVGKVDLETEPVNWHDVVEWALPIVSEKAKANGIELQTEIPDRLPAVSANERAARQILLNLLTNAIKFTPDGGEVTVTAWSANKTVAVDVRDTGVGIAPDEIDKIFDPFERSLREQSRRIEGTGLGLPLVRGLLTAMGGSVSVRSELGRGSCFTITLPIAEVEPAQTTRAELERQT